MNDETLKLFAKYCFREVSAGDYSDWAIYCLEQGLDSKNLRIMASMFNAQYTSEVEPYFIKSLDDLNLNYPDEKKCLPQYARLIARQILDKKISPIEGCSEIYKVHRNLEYESEYENWVYLNRGMNPETYEDLIIEKDGVEDAHLLEEAIIEEAAKMIYGKKTTVHQIETKPDFEFTKQDEGLFTKLWKKIF